MDFDFGFGQSSERSKETAEQLAQKLRGAIFGFMFNISRQTSGDTPLFFHYLDLSIELFQNMAFPLLFIWAPWTPDAMWFHNFVSYIVPWTYFLDSIAAYYSMLGILGVLFVTAGIVAYASTQHKLRFAGPVKLLRLALLAVSGPLYMPMFGLLTFRALNCSDILFVTGTNPETLGCGSSLFIVRAIGTFLMATMYMILSMQVRIACFEFEPKAKDLTSRPSVRIEVYIIFCRTILILSLLVLILYGGGATGNASTLNWIHCIICLICSGWLAGLHIWYIPYYNYKYAQLRAGIYLNFFWASLCFLYTNLRPYQDGGIVLVPMIPVVFAFAALFVHSRRKCIESMPLSSVLTDPTLLELKARFILMRENLLYPSSETEILSRNGKSPGDIGYDASAVLERRSGSNLADDDARAMHEAKVLSQVNSMYVQAVKELPKSCMLHIMIGTFQMVYLKNRSQCLAVTTKADGLKPFPDERFMLFKRHRDLNERAVGSDGVDYIAFERHLAMAKRNEKKATVSIVQFWAELMKKEPSIHKLETYGSAITSGISTARSSYLALIKISPKTPNVYRMYGSFLINVTNDIKKGQELIDHAEEVEEAVQREAGVFENEQDFDAKGQRDVGSLPSVKTDGMNMLSDDNGLITISGERGNMCTVLHANSTFLKIFGYKKHELVGGNVSKIIPNPFAAAHDSMVAQYLETGFAKVIDRVRQVLGVNADGYLFQFTLCVKHVVDAEGRQSFVGIAKPSRTCPTIGFAILDGNFTMLHATQSLCQVLGLRPRHAAEFDIKKLFPDITEKALVNRAGLKTVWSSSDSQYDMEWFGDALPLGGATYFICRVKFALTGASQLSLNSCAMNNPLIFSPNGSQSLTGGCPFVNSTNENAIVPDAHPPIVQSNGREIHINIPQTNSALSAGLTQPYKRGSNIGPMSPRRSGLPNVPDRDVVSRRTSVGSTRTTKSRYEAQLRITVSKKNASQLKRLDYLHNLFQLLFIILIGLSIYTNIQFSNVFNTAVSSLSKIQTHLQLTTDLITMFDGCRTIDMYRTNSMAANPNLQLGINITEAQQLVRTKYQNLKKNRMKLLNLFGTEVNITGPVQTQHTIVDATEAVFRLANIAQYTSTFSFDDLVFTPRMKYLLSSGPTFGIDLLNQSSWLTLQDYNNFISQQGNWIILYSSIGPILSFILLVVLFPIHVMIEYRRKEFLKMFYDIPRNVVKGLYQSRLQKMAEGKADKSDSEGDSDNELTNQLQLDALDSVESLNDASIIRSQNGDTKESFSIGQAYHRYMFDKRGIGLKCWVILAISCAYFFASGYTVQTFVNGNQKTGNTLYWSGQRLIMTKRASFWLREAYLISLFKMVPSYPIFVQTTDRWSTLSSDLTWTDYALLYGDPVMNNTPITSMPFTDPTARLELTNACVGSIPPDCSSYWNALMTRGMHTVIWSFTQQIDMILSFVAQMNAAAIKQQDLQNLYILVNETRQLDVEYMTPALQAAMAFLVDGPNTAASWFTSFHVAFTVCLVSGLCLFYVFVVRRLIRYMQDEMRRTSGLVYMLPADVLLTIPSFKTWSDTTEDALGRTAGHGKQTSAEKSTILHTPSLENPFSDPKSPASGSKVFWKEGDLK